MQPSKVISGLPICAHSSMSASRVSLFSLNRPRIIPHCALSGHIWGTPPARALTTRPRRPAARCVSSRRNVCANAVVRADSSALSRRRPKRAGRITCLWRLLTVCVVLTEHPRSIIREWSTARSGLRPARGDHTRLACVAYGSRWLGYDPRAARRHRRVLAADKLPQF
jgi:hypothetical protein